MKRVIIFFSMVVIFMCSCQKTTTVQLDNGVRGEQLLNENNYSEALTYYENLLEQEKEQRGEENAQVAAIYNNLSVVHMKLGNNEKSLEYSKKAKLINETIGDDRALEANYYNIGETYFYMQDYQTALDYYEKALKLERLFYRAGSPDTIQTTYAMADCYKELEKYEDGLQLLEKLAENDLKENGSGSETLCQTYRKMASLYTRLEDISNAEKFYKKAIEANRQIKSPDFEFESLMYGFMGNLFDGDTPKKAVENYQKALEYYSESDDRVDNQVYLNGQLMKNYRILGDFEKAQEYGVKTCTLTERYGTDAGVTEEEITDYKEGLKEVYCQITKDAGGTGFDNWYTANVLKEATN